MTIPKCKNKFSSHALVDPEKYYRYLRDQGKLKEQKIPSAAVICFSPAILDYARSKYTLCKKEGFNIGELHSFQELGEEVGVFVCQGVGAPGAAINLEEMIVFGVNRFFIVGTAGSLQHHANLGDLVLCDGALRDEGTSYHYLLDEDIVLPSLNLMQKTIVSLNNHHAPYRQGMTWTIDAPYRETRDEVQLYQKKGVLTVEMEAAACFSVAQYRKKEIGALFVISDTLADLQWQPKFFSEEIGLGLQRAFDVAVQVLVQK